MSKSLTTASPISRGARFFMVVTLVLGISFAGAPARAIVAPIVFIPAVAAAGGVSTATGITASIVVHTVVVGTAICVSNPNNCGPVKQALFALFNRESAELQMERTTAPNSDLDNITRDGTYKVEYVGPYNPDGSGYLFVFSKPSSQTCTGLTGRVALATGGTSSPTPANYGVDLCSITNTSTTTAPDGGLLLAGALICISATCYFNELRSGDALRWGTALNPNTIYGTTNPLRRLHIRWQCVNAAGNLTTLSSPSYNAFTTPFDAAAPLPSVDVSTLVCPSGYGLSYVRVVEQIQSVNGTWYQLNVIWQAEYTPEFLQEYAPEISTNTKPEGNAESCTWGSYQGTCLPATNTDPAPNPSPSPTTTAPPSTGDITVVLPPPVNEGTGTVNSADPSGEGCAPSGWQWLNPAAYVRATVCIFEWAFVPKNLAQSQQTIQAAINGTAVGTMLTVFDDLTAPIREIDTSEPFDCMGPKFSYSVSYWNNGAPLVLYPLQACDEPAATVATLARSVTTFTLYVGAAVAAFYAIAGTFGIKLRGDE
jgi:hypothetical protein